MKLYIVRNVHSIIRNDNFERVQNRNFRLGIGYNRITYSKLLLHQSKPDILSDTF